MKPGKIFKLSKEDKFICELTFGNEPDDKEFILDIQLFKNMKERFKNGEFKELWEYENKKSR